jgi:hypothetical protein
MNNLNEKNWRFRDLRSAILLAFALGFQLMLLGLILLHSDDDICDEHNVGHDGGEAAGERGVSCPVSGREAWHQ